jgi:hypothetical protein
MSLPHRIGTLLLATSAAFVTEAQITPAIEARQNLISLLTLKSVNDMLSEQFYLAARTCTEDRYLKLVAKRRSAAEQMEKRFESQLQRYRQKARSALGQELEQQTFESTTLRLTQSYSSFKQNLELRPLVQPKNCVRIAESLSRDAAEVEETFEWFEQQP